jgi:hypothetical protein
LLLWLAGVLFIFWAILDRSFRDSEGFLESKAVLSIVIGIALLTLGWAIIGKWRRFAFWFAIALVGQAVTLQLVEAGPQLGYQHYRIWNRLISDTNPFLLVFLVLQTGLVVIGFRKRWLGTAQWLRHHFSWWQLAAIGLVFFLTSATVSRQITVYASELILATYLQLLGLATIVLMVWAIPSEALQWLGKVQVRLLGEEEDGGTRRYGGLDRFALLAAIWVVILSSLLVIFAYERHPHVADEVAYLYHARFFANGVLTMPAPPVREAFDFYLMKFDGLRWFPTPPPGWPLMLSLGVMLGIPWLINPLLAGINILLAYILVINLHKRRTARIAILLLCLSPWYIFLAMSYMTHTFSLTCALLATLGVVWSRKTDKAVWAWLAGAALGVLSLIRPLEGLIVALLVGIWAIGIGGQRLKVSALFGLVMGAVIVGGLVLPYNKALTGEITTFPINNYTDQIYGPNANAFGFGPDRGMGWAIDPNPGHSPIDGLINANLNAFMVNVELFGWATGSLLFVALFLFSGQLQRNDYLMLANIAAFFGVYFFYYFSGGPDFGARYWFLMIIPLVVLTARGIKLLEEKLATDKKTSGAGSSRVMVGILALSLLALINFFPWRAIDKYHHYLGMRPDIRHLNEEYQFGESLVFVRGDSHPDYASAATYNPVDIFSDETLYAWDQGPAVRAEVIGAYPDRPIWFVDGPSQTGRGFEVIAGPLTADELLNCNEQDS